MASKKVVKKPVPRVRPPLKRAASRNEIDKIQDEMKGWDADREVAMVSSDVRAHDLAMDMGRQWQEIERLRTAMNDAQLDRQALYDKLKEQVFYAADGRIEVRWDVTPVGYLSMQVNVHGRDGSHASVSIDLEESKDMRDWLIRHIHVDK